MREQNIPDGWKLTRIDRILKRVRKPVRLTHDGVYREIGIRSHGKGLFYKGERTGDSIGNKSVFWIEPDCFVVNIVFAWEQAVAKTTVNEKGMIASHRFPMYKPVAEKLDLDYILYFFKTPLGKHLLGLASPGGAGRNKTLGQREFQKLTVPLPPYTEQVKIAEILSTWDKAIAITERLIAALQARKKGLMQLLLTGKIRFPGFEGRWQDTILGELGTHYSGLSSKSGDDFGNGKPFIPYKNIFANSSIDPNWLNYVKIRDGEIQNSVRYGDIFFTTSSETPNEVGISSVLLDELEECYLNSFCFGFRLHNFSKLLPEFAQFMLRGAEFRRKTFKLAQGYTRYNLSKRELLKLRIELPDITEQRKIAKILSACSAEISLYQNKLIFLKDQKKGLIQRLLTGQVRVKV